ncbi:MAG: hypothetical protein J6U92_02195, partial [Clostridia bacterium]|nr:hypothetical protein [Clostridia bacterium]
ICAITAMVCAFGFALGLYNAKANDSSFVVQFDANAEEYLDSYGLGDTLQIKSAKILYKGNEYNATSILHYPNGVTLSTNSVTLEQVGRYKVEYKAIVDGKVLSKSIPFAVYDDLFSINGRGTISYGTPGDYLPGREGLNLSLQQGDVFTFNKVLDLSNSTKETTPIIKFYATPLVAGENEIDMVTLKLTDIYDSNNFVEVRYKQTDKTVYIDGKANGQNAIGLHWQNKASTTIDYEGGCCRIFSNHSQYGYGANTSFTGIAPKYAYGFENNYCTLMLDSKEHRLYAQRSVHASSGLVVDLDDPVLYEDNLWSGFTTGEVILSLSASGSSISYNLFIESIMGNDLTKESAENNVSISVGVDFGKYTEDTIPNAVVGKKYSVYPILIPEISGMNVIDSGVLVYYNYNSNARTLVDVTNGEFSVTKEGVYTLYYHVEDSWGNVSVKTVDVTAIVREPVTVDFGDYQSQFVVGNQVAVANPTFSNIIDGYTVKTYATLKSSNIVYDVVDGKFLPMYSGDYEIRYDYKDELGEATFKYDLTVAKSDTPLCEGDAQVPKYVIKGFDYAIPDYLAYDFSNGTQQIKGQLYLSQDGGQPTLINNNKFTVTAENYVDLTFKFDNGKETVEKAYFNIPVVDIYDQDDKLNVWQMLQGSDFTVTPGTDFTTYSLTKETATLEVVNSVHVNLFELVFVANGNLDSVFIELVNLSNRSDVAKISFVDGQDGVKVVAYRNGVLVKEILTNNEFNSNVEISTSVVDGNIVFSETNDVISVAELLGGFADKMFMSVGVDGVTDSAILNIYKVNGLRLRTGTTRPSAPTLLYNERVFQGHSVGEVVELAFDAYDFVDTSPTCSFAVIDNKTGNYVVSDEGVLLDGVSNDFFTTYHITITDYFEYSVIFSLGNDWRPASPKAQEIIIVDKDVPTIQLDVKVNTYNLNSKVEVAKPIVIDDKDGEIKYSVFVIDANEYMTYLSDDLSFVADKKGVYQIIYLAVDSSGNVALANYYIQVK